jgi:hypothetical protein
VTSMSYGTNDRSISRGIDRSASPDSSCLSRKRLPSSLSDVTHHLARSHELGDHQRFTLKWIIAVSDLRLLVEWRLDLRKRVLYVPVLVGEGKRGPDLLEICGIFPLH